MKEATAMTATKYIFWLTFAMFITFWRLSPWTWAKNLCSMPAAFLTLLALEPEERYRSIENGVSYLDGEMKDGYLWMPGFVWRRICALVGRPA
jgi:hypothetical protein